MNNEIKEILDNPKIIMLSYGNFILLDDYIKLKDYITNLQEINNNLKEDFKRHIDRINELTNRIEKAIEYIEEMQVWCIEFDDYGVITDGLLNILRGEDK